VATESLLADARRVAGMSQDERARRAHTSRPTLSACEHGRKSPTLESRTAAGGGSDSSGQRGLPGIVRRWLRPATSQGGWRSPESVPTALAWPSRNGHGGDRRQDRDLCAANQLLRIPVSKVRAFYLDLSQCRWAQWVAHCPVRQDDISHRKFKRRHKARTDARTRAPCRCRGQDRPDRSALPHLRHPSYRQLPGLLTKLRLSGGGFEVDGETTRYQRSSGWNSGWVDCWPPGGWT
jgi:hypothetical protein